MKKISLITPLLLMSLFNNFALAESISDASINKLLNLSGMTKQVAEMPAMFEMGIEQASKQTSGMPESSITEIKKSLASAFEPSKIINAISAELKENISESDAKDLFKWYESALAKRITKAEEDASTPAEFQKMMQSAETLLTDQKRVKFAKNLDNLLKVTDMSMQLQQNAAVASYVALSTAMEPNKPLNIQQFKAQVGNQMQQGRANMERLVITSFVYSYKDIAMADLNKYEIFLKRPQTRRFNDASKKGLITALDQAIHTMSETLAAHLKQQKVGI